MLNNMKVFVPMAVAPTYAPLAQVDPLQAYGRGLLNMFSTHPPVAERIARLEGAREPGGCGDGVATETGLAVNAPDGATTIDERSKAMRTAICTTAIALVTGLVVGCGSVETAQDREQLVKRAQVERQAWVKVDPSVEELLRKSYGYALFPEVGSGGFIVAGSGGSGVVFERGQHVGYAELTGGSIGFTVGGQKASELIVFENKAAMDRFREGKLTFGVGANAVIVKSGAAATAPFTDGVAVLVRPLGGAMAEASLGGQNFKFIPR